MIYPYEYSTHLPSPVAAARPLVPHHHSGVLCLGLRIRRLFCALMVRGEMVFFVCRHRTRHFWAFLFMVVANTTSLLLCSYSHGRIFVYADFPVHHEHGAQLLYAGQWSTGSHLPNGYPREYISVFLFLVASDGERGSLRLAADGLDSLFAFRPFLPVVFFLSKGLPTDPRRPRLPQLPAPSFLSSLFPPTAALSRLRGLSPCPPAFVFGGAA